MLVYVDIYRSYKLLKTVHFLAHSVFMCWLYIALYCICIALSAVGHTRWTDCMRLNFAMLALYALCQILYCLPVASRVYLNTKRSEPIHTDLQLNPYRSTVSGFTHSVQHFCFAYAKLFQILTSTSNDFSFGLSLQLGSSCFGY